jgi:hypothetical protein
MRLGLFSMLLTTFATSLRLKHADALSTLFFAEFSRPLPTWMSSSIFSDSRNVDQRDQSDSLRVCG